MKKRGSTVLLLVVLLVGLSLLSYPKVSDWWNSFHQSRAIMDYTDKVANLDKEEYDRILSNALAYNHRWAREGGPALLSPERLADYNSQLDAVPEAYGGTTASLNVELNDTGRTLLDMIVPVDLSWLKDAELNLKVGVQDGIMAEKLHLLLNDTVLASINYLFALEDRQICFQYCEWTLSRELSLKRNGERYRISPWKMIWKDENYYLIGLDEKSGIVKLQQKPSQEL